MRNTKLKFRWACEKCIKLFLCSCFGVCLIKKICLSMKKCIHSFASHLMKFSMKHIWTAQCKSEEHSLFLVLLILQNIWTARDKNRITFFRTFSLFLKMFLTIHFKTLTLLLMLRVFFLKKKKLDKVFVNAIYFACRYVNLKYFLLRKEVLIRF